MLAHTFFYEIPLLPVCFGYGRHSLYCVHEIINLLRGVCCKAHRTA